MLPELRCFATRLPLLPRNRTSPMSVTGVIGSLRGRLLINMKNSRPLPLGSRLIDFSTDTTRHCMRFLAFRSFLFHVVGPAGPCEGRTILKRILKWPLPAAPPALICVRILAILRAVASGESIESRYQPSAPCRCPRRSPQSRQPTCVAWPTWQRRLKKRWVT